MDRRQFLISGTITALTALFDLTGQLPIVTEFEHSCVVDWKAGTSFTTICTLSDGRKFRTENFFDERPYWIWTNAEDMDSFSGLHKQVTTGHRC